MYKESQTPEAGKFVRRASLTNSFYKIPKKKKSISLPFLLSFNPDSSYPVVRLYLWRISWKGACCSLSAWLDLSVCLDAWGTPIPNWVSFHFTLLSTNGALSIWLWIQTFCVSWVHWHSIGTVGKTSAQCDPVWRSCRCLWRSPSGAEVQLLLIFCSTISFLICAIPQPRTPASPEVHIRI